MAIPKKGSRTLINEQINYRYLIKDLRDKCGYLSEVTSSYQGTSAIKLGLTIQQEDYGKVLQVVLDSTVWERAQTPMEEGGIDHKATLFPDDIRTIIDLALRQGWEPQDRGAAFQLTSSLVFRDYKICTEEPNSRGRYEKHSKPRFEDPGTSPRNLYLGDAKSDEFYETLSPGIRKLVRQLNEWDFDTTDSGDGTNHKEGMGCAVPWPMIVIMIDREKKDPFKETDRLANLLWDSGVKLGTERVPGYLRGVQLTYSPLDRNCIVTVDNILDSDLS